MQQEKIIENDLKLARQLIENRDSEIKRLSSLYESNVNIDKVVLN